MPDPDNDIDRFLRDYVHDRDTVADRVAPMDSLDAKAILREAEQAQGEPLPDDEVDAQLRHYVAERDAVSERVPALSRDDVKLILDVIGSPREDHAKVPVRDPWWAVLLQRRVLLPSLAAAAVVVLLALVFPSGPKQPTARVVLASAGLTRGGPAVNESPLSLPLTLELFLPRLDVRIVESNGVSYVGTLSGEQTEQSDPHWRRVFTLQVAGTNLEGKVVRLRGTFLLTTEAPASDPTHETSVLSSSLEELVIVVGGTTSGPVRLEKASSVNRQ